RFRTCGRLLDRAALRLRLIPAEGTESVGANDLRTDTVEFSRKRRVCAALLEIDKHYSLGGVLRTDAHANAENRVLEHEALGMALFRRHGPSKAGRRDCSARAVPCRDSWRCCRACERRSRRSRTDKADAQGGGNVRDA